MKDSGEVIENILRSHSFGGVLIYLNPYDGHYFRNQHFTFDDEAEKTLPGSGTL